VHHRRRSHRQRPDRPTRFQLGPRLSQRVPRDALSFDLVEIDGEGLRWRPIEDRKAALKKLVSNKHPGIAFNKHFDVEGSIVFHHALQARMRSHRVETPRLALSVRPIEGLDQDQESGLAGGKAGG
jgi:hypothetical protein